MVIAVAGVMALVAPSPKPKPPSEPVVATPAVVLDGVYRSDHDRTKDTIMVSPNPPLYSDPPAPDDTSWRAFRSACSTSTFIIESLRRHRLRQ